MRAAWVMVGAGLALAGCVGPYSDQPMRMSPPLGYSSPAYSGPAYVSPGYQPPPYQPPSYQPPAYEPLPPPPEPSTPSGMDDLPPVVFQPNAPLTLPDPTPATPAQAPDPTPAPAPAPAPVASPAVPERGGDVPLMGFRPMKGQKAPTPTTTP